MSHSEASGCAQAETKRQRLSGGCKTFKIATHYSFAILRVREIACGSSSPSGFIRARLRLSEMKVVFSTLYGSCVKAPFIQEHARANASPKFCSDTSQGPNRKGHEGSPHTPSLNMAGGCNG